MVNWINAISNLLVSYTFIKFANLQSIDIPYEGFNYMIQISIDFGNEIIKAPVNMEKPYTWITFLDLDRIKTSQTKINEGNKLKIGKELYQSQDICHNITIYNYTFEYRFYAANISQYQVRDAGFGFAYGFTNKLFSLPHLLKKNKIINYAAFTFVPFSPGSVNLNGTMHFGAAPIEKVKGKKQGKCLVADAFYTWGCKLKEVHIGNIHFINNFYMLFSATKSNIHIPQSFFELFKREFIDPSGNKCIVSINELKEYYFTCDFYYFIDLNYEMQFVFGDYQFTLNLIDLFDCDGVVCTSLMVFDDIYVKQWTFGYAFFNHYFTTFDYEKGEISFFGKSIQKIYSNENLPLDFVQDSNLLKYLYKLLILILLSNIIFLSFFKNKMKSTLVKAL